MSQEPTEERLSGTMVGGLQGVAAVLGTLSTTLSILGLGSLLVAIILLIVASDLWFYSVVLAIVGAVLLLAALFISFQTVKAAVTSRQGRYSTNTIIMAVAFIGIAAVVSFLAFENSVRVDVTATNQFTMAPQTKEILKDLGEDIEVRAFFVPARGEQEQVFFQLLRNQIEDFLREFKARSGKFSYEFLDPIVERLVAEQYEATSYPTVIFESQTSKKRHEVSYTDYLQQYGRTGRLPSVEQEFVTALLIVTGQQQKKVYFLQGHEEKDIFDVSPGTVAMGLASDAMRNENYATEGVSLFLEDSRVKLVPDEGSPEPDVPEVNMLVIAAPQRDFLEGEAELLDKYLRGGGKMVVLVEPGLPPSFRDFLERWGVLVGDGHIVDQRMSSSSLPGYVFFDRGKGSYAVLPGVPEVTRELKTTYHPGLIPVEPSEGITFLTPRPKDEDDEEEEQTEIPRILGSALAVTSEDSWLIKEATRNEPRPDEDRQDFYFPAIAIRAIAPLFIFSLGLEHIDALENGPVSGRLREQFDDHGITLAEGSSISNSDDGTGWLISNGSDEGFKVVEQETRLIVDTASDELNVGPGGPASILVIGDADFVTNDHFFSSNNGDLFLNSINWLVGDVPLAHIRPKPVAYRALNLTRNEEDFVKFSGYLLLPVLMALLGGFVWWRRR